MTWPYYTLAAVARLWLVEHRRSDRWDLLGAGVCALGAGVILFGPRPA